MGWIRNALGSGVPTILDEEMAPVSGGMSRRRFLGMMIGAAMSIPFRVWGKDSKFIVVTISDIDETRESLGAVVDHYCEPNVFTRYYGTTTLLDALKKLATFNKIKGPNYVVYENQEIKIPREVVKQAVKKQLENFAIAEVAKKEVTVHISSKDKHRKSVGAIADHYCDANKLVKYYKTRSYMAAVIELSKANKVNPRAIPEGAAIVIPREVLKKEVETGYEAVAKDLKETTVPAGTFQSPFGGSTKVATHTCFAGTQQNNGAGSKRICPFDKFNATRGRGRKHAALDAWGKIGTPLYPIKAGKLVGVGKYYLTYKKKWKKKRFVFANNNGNAIKVQCSDGYTYMYIHMKTVNFSIANLLKKGPIEVGHETILGTLGISGNASSANPHVHIKLSKNGVTVDPLEHLSFIG